MTAPFPATPADVMEACIIMSLRGSHALHATCQKKILYKPELYDIVTSASFRGDAEWYRDKARQCGGPVLELGAGTGRITLGIAQDGVPVHALDADPAMLETLRQKLAQQPPELRSNLTRDVAS